MYRSDGAHHTVPYEVPWLPGWEASRPVHVGNPAADQFQLDVYGEVLDSLHHCERRDSATGRGTSRSRLSSPAISRKSGSSLIGASGSRAIRPGVTHIQR
jgi:hypothetical protein